MCIILDDYSSNISITCRMMSFSWGGLCQWEHPVVDSITGDQVFFYYVCLPLLSIFSVRVNTAQHSADHSVLFCIVNRGR